MSKKVENISSNKKMFDFLSELTIFLIIVAFLLLGLAACSSQKNLVDNSTINKTDSVSESKEVIHDTVTLELEVIVHDTVYKESSDESSINFVPGGGSYNVETGQATGVTSVNLSKKYKESESKNEKLTASLNEIKEENRQLRDSISGLHQQNAIKSEEGLKPIQAVLIKTAIILIIIYLLRIIFKVFAIKYPVLKPITKITDWLP